MTDLILALFSCATAFFITDNIIMISHFRALYRVVGIFTLVSGFVLYNALYALIAGHNYHWTLRTRRKFSRLLLWFLEVEYEQQGQAPEGAFIFAGNHRTYLDAVLAHQDMMALPVAKAEVGSWPLIGFGVKISGVLLVKREDGDSRKQTRSNILAAIRDGYSVLVYPEGTTHDQPVTIDFRPGTFRLAADHGIPVVPVAVEYRDPEDAFIRDESFIPHLYKCFRKPHIAAKIRFGQPIQMGDPALLRMHVQSWIDEQLTDMRMEFGLPVRSVQPAF